MAVVVVVVIVVVEEVVVVEGVLNYCDELRGVGLGRTPHSVLRFAAAPYMVPYKRPKWGSNSGPSSECLLKLTHTLSHSTTTAVFKLFLKLFLN